MLNPKGCKNTMVPRGKPHATHSNVLRLRTMQISGGRFDGRAAVPVGRCRHRGGWARRLLLRHRLGGAGGACAVPPTSISSFVVHNSYVFVVETALVKICRRNSLRKNLILVKPTTLTSLIKPARFPPGAPAYIACPANHTSANSATEKGSLGQ